MQVRTIGGGGDRLDRVRSGNWLRPLRLGTIGILAIAAASCQNISPNAPQLGSHFYVSLTGDDSHAGTAAQPFQTLDRARQAVRAKLPNATGDIVVELAAGTYVLDRVVAFDEQDSGHDGHSVIYTAAPNSAVVLSGGVTVTGWKSVDANKNLWSAPAPLGLDDTRQIYVDGIRATRASGRLPAELTQTDTGYTASSDALSHWRNPAAIEFVYTGGNPVWSEPNQGLGAWTEPRCPVASINGNTITMAQPCWNNSIRRVDLPEKWGFKRSANLVGPGHVGKVPAFVENAYELLGTPGQFYFDRSAKTIFYTPRTGEHLDHANVIAAKLEKLIDGHGTSGQPVHDIAFRGIQFSYATWTYPNSPEGFSEIQANYLVTGEDGYSKQGLGHLVDGGKEPFGAWTQTPGNVAFTFAHHITFEDCVFAHLGAAGLALGHGTQDSLVRGCIFTDISGNGLSLGNVDQPLADEQTVTRNTTIANNHFFNLPVEYHGGIAIASGYLQNCTIAHNQLDHLPYAGISIGWGGWPDKIKQPGVANNSHDNVICNNLLFDHMLMLADGGGIYTQGLTGPDLTHGEKVTGNYVHDQYGTGHAIYSDNGSANMTITGNAMVNDNFDNWGSAHANYYDGRDGSQKDWITVAGNYWQQGTPDSDKDNLKFDRNHLIAHANQVPQALIDQAGLEPAYRKLLSKKFIGMAATPTAPTRISAYAGNGEAYIAFCPSTGEGIDPIRDYKVIASSGQTASIGADEFRKAGYITIKGLTNDQPCTFVVTAANRRGTSPSSLQSLPVTPNATPPANPNPPSITHVYANDGAVSVHFLPPAKDGGRPVIGYRIHLEPSGKETEVLGRRAIALEGRHQTFAAIDGLTNGTAYTATITAITPGGETTSPATRPVTPSNKPNSENE